MRQDTGMAVLLLRLDRMSLKYGHIEDAINEGRKTGLTRSYLRKLLLRSRLATRQHKGSTSSYHHNIVTYDKLTLYLQWLLSEHVSAQCLNFRRLEGAKWPTLEIMWGIQQALTHPHTVGVGIGGIADK